MLLGAVQNAFRLTEEGSLLNLEYYFINCCYKGNKVWAQYGPFENYMVVRLPQQHMAEQNFKENDKAATPWKSASYISGYSYLVFRILFPGDGWLEGMFTRQDGKFSFIKLDKTELLDWNSPKLRLVVRQDLTQSIFELQKTRAPHKPENYYPFQYEELEGAGVDSERYNRNAIPKVYDDPVTAIELPWRLIVSPNLPDSSKYIFAWDRKPMVAADLSRHLLWTATLRVSERTDDNYLGQQQTEAAARSDDPGAGGKTVKDTLQDLELLIIGSPDHPKVDSAYLRPDFLPNCKDRRELVDLYTKLKVIGRIEQLTFSPLGASVNIHFNNNVIQKAADIGLDLIEWEQLISFGRDEKVEIASLFLEREFGHKMLYVRTAQRRLVQGSYALIRIDYIQPLDLTKDYTSHLSQNVLAGGGEDAMTISRFNTPFKQITFLETKPKKVDSFDQTNPAPTGVSFQFEATDWQDNVIKFSKQINALPLGAVLDDSSTTPNVKAMVKAEERDQSLNLAAGAEKLVIKSREQLLNDFPPKLAYAASRVLDDLFNQQGKINQNIKNELAKLFPGLSGQAFDDQYNQLEDILALAQEKLDALTYTLAPDKFCRALIQLWLEKRIFSDPLFVQIRAQWKSQPEWARGGEAGLVGFYDWLNKDPLTSDPYYLLLLAASPVLATLLLSTSKLVIQLQTAGQALQARLKDKYDNYQAIVVAAKEIPNLILLQKQKIGYAIRERVDSEAASIQATVSKVSGEVKKSLSLLESEYITFEGKYRVGESDDFDFFHDYAIMPQLRQAQVYVSALNKLINEELPMSINYAAEYVDNQLSSELFEYKQNGAMVFAEIRQNTRLELQGIMKKLSSKMPGFNVEIPAHYLTYLRNPKEVSTEVFDELGYKDIGGQVAEASKDLIFISETAKDAVKTVEDLRNMDPKTLFKDLGATLFGSIRLEDILDIGFDLPRITELPDKIIYQFSNTRFTEHKAAFVVFRPDVGGETRLDLFISKSLKDGTDFFAYTKLNNFQVGVVIGSAEVLTVNFDQFKVTSTPQLPRHTEISVGKVALGGPLEFIADLAEKFMAPGNGMHLSVGANSLALDYAIAFPDVNAPAFHFHNLQLVVGLNIPFDPGRLEPISFTFGVNKPEDKFLVAAGIYGGRGHFLLRSTPKGIEHIDISMELGAYGQIDLGIGHGEVFLFFGFWFVCGREPGSDQNSIKAVAYVICAGSAMVLGFISIGVSVLISLTYEKRGQEASFSGDAVVTYSIKVALFKKEFSIHYHKQIAGSSQGSGTSAPAMITLGMIGAGGGVRPQDKKKDRVAVTDVFEDADAMETYFACFNYGL